MKLEELLKVATGTIVTIDDGEVLRTGRAETLLRNLREAVKTKEVKNVRILYGNMQVLIADELEEKQNGTQKSKTEN